MSRVRLTSLPILGLLVLFLAAPVSTLAGGPGGDPDSVWLTDMRADQQATPGAKAAIRPKADGVTFREDRGRVAVLEVEGDYDRFVDGQLNSALRAAVGREFFAHHPDSYDFLVAFTTFEVDLGEQVLGLHLGVRNPVAGIGRPVFDNSAVFGSDGKLQAYIDMGSTDRQSTQPLEAEFETTLTVLSHELMHQWCCYVDFQLPSGATSGALLGAGDHWSYLLDSDASVMFGSDWQDRGDGSFASLRRQRAFGPLDRYLAGWLSAEEVAATLLIDNPAIDPDTLPAAPGTVVSGTASSVAIDAVVAAEGPRLPAAGEAQRDFKIAFLLLVRPGEALDTRDLAGIERLATEIATRFTVLSGGRALADVGPPAGGDGSTGTPGGTVGGDLRPAPDLDLDAALAWLRGRQHGAGYWQDSAGTRVRDTVVALGTLSALDPSFARAADALAWLAAQDLPSTDSTARLATTLSLAGQDATALRAELLERQNADGGWGIERGWASDPLDSALALQAVAGSPAEDAAIAYLESSQGADGGWGHLAHGPSRTTVTTAALRAFAAADYQGPARSAALAFLGARQNAADGGFGDSPSTVHDTAQVISSLLRLDALAGIDSPAAGAFLESRQTVDGSWAGSVYATALAVDSLRRSEVADLAVNRALTATPATPRDGQRVRLELGVRNTSSTVTGATVVRFFDGLPEQGGMAIGEAPLPSLDAGESTLASTTWDTFDQAGPHRIVAWIDPDQQLAEADEGNNRAELDLTVEPPPAGIDLEIDGGEVVVMPARPDSLPSQIEIAAVVRNFGATGAEQVALRLYLGPPEDGQLLDQTVLPEVAPRNSASGLLSFALTDPGSFELWLEAAPEGDVDPANNRLRVVVETAPALDLEVLASDLAISSDPAVAGSDVTFTVVVRNRGTVDSVSFDLAFAVTDGTATRQLPTLSTQLAAGRTAQFEVGWRVDLVGALTFSAAADPEGLVPEVDEGNNLADLSFAAVELTEPNLTIASLDLEFDPEPALEGSPLGISLLVRNTGGTDLANVAVAFWDGDPTLGGPPIGSAVIAALAAGSSARASTSWQVAGDQDRLIYATVDPDQVIAEIDEGDNLAFRPLSVIGLPDLALSNAALSLQPPFPAPGELASLAARISNLGERPSGPFRVRAVLIDENGSEELIGEQDLAVAAFAEGLVSFSLTLPAADQPGILRVTADADDTVAETDESNNQASLTFAVQGGDAFVSERYFSPDGDGVQDHTQLFFRLPEPLAVDVVVRDAGGAGVRRFAGATAAGAASGDVIWDGRDDLGRLAIDGDYTLTVESADGSERFGQATVSLDTDRSSARLALGSEFARFSRFTCELYTTERFVLTDDERWLYLQARDNSFQPGLYRTRPAGPGGPQEVLQGNVTDFAISATGDRLAFSPNAVSGDFEDVFLAAGDGSGAGLVRASSRILDFDHLERLLLLHRNGGSDRLEALPRGGGAPVELAAWPATDDWRHALSSDRRRLAVLVGDTELWLFDLAAGSSATVTIPGASSPFTLPIDGGDHAVLRWSPDGGLLAIADEGGEQIHLVEGSGQLLSSAAVGDAAYPESLMDLEEFSISNYANAGLRDIRSIEWNGRGDRLAVLLSFGSNSIEFFALTTVTSSGAVETVAWSQAIPPAPVKSPISLGKAGLEPTTVKAAFGQATELLPLAPDEIPRRIEWWRPDDGTLLYGPFAIELRDGLPIERIFADFDDFSPLAFAASGRGLIFSTLDGIGDPGCFGTGVPDLWSFFSLLNLWAELSVAATEQPGAFELRGTAADLHLASWRLEWRRTTEAAEDWRPIAAPSNEPRVEQPLGQWVAPGPGLYEVRLVVEDLAGNQRQVRRTVATADTPSIANLRLEPVVFSAVGGSSTANATEVIYDVLRPVNLRFDIFDGAGTFVTTLLRDHPTVGSGFRQPWNGTDSLGRPVPDGTYTLHVSGLELVVRVDSQPPEIEHFAATRTTRPVGETGCPLEVNDLVPLRVFDIFERNLGGVEIERGSGASPALWQAVGPSSVACFDGGQIQPPPPAGQVPDQRCVVTVPSLTDELSYRLIATDQAGNRTVVASPPSFGNRLMAERMDPAPAGRDLRLGNRLSPFAPPLLLPGELLLQRAGTLQLQVAESASGPLSALTVELRALGSADLWQAQPVSSTEPLDGRFSVFWDSTTAPRGIDLEVRLRGLAGDGTELLSGSFPLHLEPLQLRGRLRPEDLDPDTAQGVLLSDLVATAGLDLERQSVLWAVVSSAAPGLRLTASISSADDPAFAASQVLPTAISDQGVYLLVPRLPLDENATYRVDLRLGHELPSCQRPGPSFELSGDLGPRPQVEIEANFDAIDCDPSSASLEIAIKTRGTELASLRLDQLIASETSTVFSTSQPRDGETYTYQPALALPLAEDVRYRATLLTAAGESATAELELRAQPALPVVEFSQPAAGQRLCGDGQIQLAGSVDSVGSADSADPAIRFDYHLEVSQAGGSWRLFHEVENATDFAGPITLYGDSPDEPALAGGPASWRLRVLDQAGNLVCREVETEIIEVQQAPLVALDTGLISPDGNGVLDQLTVSYDSADPATLTLSIRDPAGSLVRQLASAVTITGGGGLTWDGRDDGGLTVADGVYTVAAEFGGLCSPQQRLLAVEVDTTPPAVEIAFPRPGDPLDTLLEVFGSASDRNFAHYTLEHSATGSGVWSLIDSATTPRQNSLLASWNSFGLEGAHSLRLRADDRAGNRAETQVDLHFDQRQELVTDLQTVPTLISPNGDGELDRAAIVFGLSAAAEVDLQIVDQGGAVVRDLLRGTQRGAGTHTTSWAGDLTGGATAADGDYRVRLTAAPLDDPLALQVEDVALTIDSSPPSLVLDQPAGGGVVRGTAKVTGSVADPHLLTYLLELAGDPAGPWSELASGSVERLGYDFAQLDNLADGSYTLRLTAADAAANRGTLVVPFVADSTPPEVGWFEPADGTIVGSLNGPVSLLGRVIEHNLVQYRFEFGAGPDPAAWTVIAAGSELAGGPVTSAWDVATVADGTYTLRLVAEDGAGWVSEARLAVVVDNTPPTVALTAPGGGDFVTGPTSIEGTANDLHLVDYRLAVASAGSQAFSEIFVGQQAVAAGLLASWAALPPDGSHVLRLSASDEAGWQAKVEIGVEIDLTPPPPVTLSGTLRQGRTAELSWTTSPAADLAGYAVYRDGAQITPEPIAGTELTDPQLATGTYRYTVRAVDLAGLESPDSNLVELTVDIDPPLAVILRPAAGERVRGLVEVVGSAHSAADFAEYRLSIASGDLTTGDGAWQLLRRSPVPVLADELGQWQAPAAGEEVYTLRLEAEDLAGNVADVRLLLTVDNGPPAAPTGLAASASSDDVTATWNANSEPDLAGYLLYRDGELLGGGDAADLASFLIAPSGGATEQYLDPAVADGEHTYTVVAMDQAGNLSPPSLPASVGVETGPPRALIVTPEGGTDFDQSLFIAATSEDLDTAQVQFQHRASGESAWTDLATDLEAPWETTWDPAALPFGDYQLRALATDLGGASDPAPPTITVRYRDLTAPAAVDGLTLVAVDGGRVDLSWNANTADADLAGYRVYRALGDAPPVELGSGPSSTTTYTDSGLADELYRYTVRAIDGAGNPSLASNAVDALVYTPTLDPATSPTAESTAELSGTTAVAGASLEATVTGPSGTQALPPVTADAAGAFVLPSVPLERGSNTLAVRSRSGVVLSKPASLVIVSAPPPATPTGLAAQVDGQQVDLAWNANSEPDLLGYHLQRDGVRITGTALPDAAFGEQLFDGTYGYQVTAINIHGFESLPSAVLEVEVGDGVPPEPVVLSGQAEGADVVLAWTASPSTDVVRYRVFRDGSEIAQHDDLGDLTYRDPGLANATYLYQVAAVDAGGNTSELSNQVAVTVAAPPPPAPEILTVVAVAEGGALEITWQAAAGSAPAAYELRRATISGGPYAIVLESPGTRHQDEGLTAGLEYFYVVLARDELGNRSAPSAEASGIPSEPAPLPPPVFTQPTAAGTPLLTEQPTVTLGGIAEPGSTVRLTRDGAELGQVSASGEQTVTSGPPVDDFFSASPDGHRVVYFDGIDLRVYDFETDTAEVIGEIFPPARFFADGASVALANDGQLSRYRLADGTLEVLETIDFAFAAEPAPDGAALAVLGSRDGIEGIWLYELDSGNWTLLLQDFGVSVVRWSPDGQWLAYRRGIELAVLDVSSAARQVVAGDARGNPDWSPDSSSLAWTRRTADGGDLWLYRLGTGTSTPLIEAPGAQVEPRFSPGGAFVGYLDGDGSLYQLALASGQRTPLLDVGSALFMAQYWSWTAADQLVVADDFELSRLTPGGRFRLEGVALEPGDNRFEATASDGLGRTSGPAAPILVSLDLSQRPDLRLDAAGLTLVPAVGRPGEPLRLAVEIRNDGARPAPASELGALLIAAEGATDALGSPRAVPALEAGATATVLFDLGPFAATGSYQIRLRADAADQVEEVSEANNQAALSFRVLDASAPVLELSTNQATYGRDQQVQIGALVLNSGETWSGTLSLAIEDTGGFLVQALGSTVIEGLAFGAERLVASQWNTGDTFAGRYRVRGRLLDPAGGLVAETLAEFVLDEDLELAAELLTDRASYVRGEPVELTGALSYLAGNAALTGATASLMVTDPTGGVQGQWHEPLGTLLPGGGGQLQRVWASTGVTGPHTARFEVERSGSLLIAAEATFELLDQEPLFAELTASKTVELADDPAGDGQAGPGDSLRYRIEITNLGTGPATAVVLEDPIPAHTGLVVGSVSGPGTLTGIDPLRLELGELGAGASVAVTFEVRIDDPLAGGATEIVNQGTVSADGLDGLPTDDPATAAPLDPTRLPIRLGAELAVRKVDSLALDADGSGGATAGDTLAYEITVENRGQAAAEAVELRDFLPAHTVLVGGSAASSQGTVEDLDPLRVDLGQLAPGETATVTFEVLIDPELEPGVTEISNQAMVSSATLPVVLSDDPELSGDADPTVTPLDLTPRLVAEKTVEVDAADPDGAAGPGDLLQYRIVLRNVGNGSARDLVLGDELPANTTIEPGSAATDRGIVRSEQPLEVVLDRLPAGATATVTFALRIDPSLPAGVEQIVNQATVDATGLPQLLSDDPALAGAADPTAIAVTGGSPLLRLDKTALLFDDADGNGLLSPGDGLLYRLEVRNSGDGPASGLVLSDDLTPLTTLIEGTVQTSQGTVTSELPPQIDLGQLAAGDDAVVTFVVRIADPFPADQLAVVNQARLTSTELPPLDSDDPATAEPGDATASPVYIVPTVSAADTTVPEDGGEARFTLTLDRAANRPLTVDWQTADGSAVAGADYLATSGSSAFAAGQTAAEILVTVLDDALDERDETFILELTGAAGAVLGDASGAATITDQDPAPELSLGDATVSEGDGGSIAALLPLELSAPSGLEVTATYSTADGTATADADYTAGSGSRSIPAGEISATLTVEVLGDLVDELDEDFTVRLDSAENAALVDELATVTITDDDEARLAIDDLTVTEGDAGATDALFEVTLSTASDRPVSVDYQTEDDTAVAGEDYQASSGNLRFEPGQTRGQAAVPILGDELLEALAETFHVDLLAPSGAAIERHRALGTIVDDELCLGDELLSNPGAETLGGEGELAAWQEIAGEDWQARTLDPPAAEGEAYFAAGEPGAADPAELAQEIDLAVFAGVIDRGELLIAFSAQLRTFDELPADTARVVVEYLDAEGLVVLDAFDSGEITSPLAWLAVSDLRTAPVGSRRARVRLLSSRLNGLTADGYFDALSLRTVRLPQITIGDLALSEADPGPALAELPVRLSCALDRDLAIAWETREGSALAGEDFTAASGVVVIARGELEGTVPVAVLSDGLSEGAEDLFVDLLSVDPAEIALVTDPTGRIEILGDDFCPRSPGYWKNHLEAWPLTGLLLGGEPLDSQQMLALLGYGGPDAASKLARQLIATELNLASGSPAPSILDTVEAAHDFLVHWPPGSRPRGSDKQTAEALKDELDAYNNQTCAGDDENSVSGSDDHE